MKGREKDIKWREKYTGGGRRGRENGEVVEAGRKGRICRRVW